VSSYPTNLWLDIHSWNSTGTRIVQKGALEPDEPQSYSREQLDLVAGSSQACSKSVLLSSNTCGGAPVTW
jgi:hypothetical protein